MGSAEELLWENWLNRWGMLILGKTQWEDVDMVKVIMDLSSWGRVCSPSAQQAGELRWRQQVTKLWQEAISCSMSGCWVSGCKKSLSQVHGIKFDWGLLNRNVPSVLQGFSKTQVPGAWYSILQNLQLLFIVYGMIWAPGYHHVLRLYTWSSQNCRQKLAGQQENCI